MRRGWASPAGQRALVGRDAELERLASAVAAARAGRGQIVLISGEPGIGKTAILTSGRASPSPSSRPSSPNRRWTSSA